MVRVQNSDEFHCPPFHSNNGWHGVAAEKTFRAHQAHQLRIRALEHGLRKLCGEDLPGMEHPERYLRQEYRLNFSAHTIRKTLSSIQHFQVFLKSSGRTHLEQITRGDLEAFSMSRIAA